MQFLSNPCEIWASERLERKRTVLKLTFLDGLVYSRNEGFRTPQLTVPFTLFGNPADFGAMAEREGFSSNSVFETLADWEHQLQHLENTSEPSVGDDFGGAVL